METELKSLIEANRPEKRMRSASRWLEQSGEVMGYIGPNVPEEIIHAVGMLPVAASGTWDATTPLSSVYRPSMTCVYCTHVLEALLNGELDYLKAVVTTQHDDDFKRLWDVIHYLNKPRDNYLMYLPHVNNPRTLSMWRESIRDFRHWVEALINARVRDEKLSGSIAEFNKTRRLLHRLYKMRKREVLPLSGAEMLGITTASRIMPKEEFNRQLEALMPYIEERKAAVRETSPRILVSSDFLEHPGYLELIENAGCVVVMDDLDAGSRYFWEYVDEDGDPWESLAQRYLRVSSPRMANWEEQIEQLIQWVREYKVDGVIELRQLYAFPREFRFSYGSKKLKEAGVPHQFLRVEYHLSGEGMLATRVEAFIEMLRGGAF